MHTFGTTGNVVCICYVKLKHVLIKFWVWFLRYKLPCGVYLDCYDTDCFGWRLRGYCCSIVITRVHHVVMCFLLWIVWRVLFTWSKEQKSRDMLCEKRECLTSNAFTESMLPFKNGVRQCYKEFQYAQQSIECLLAGPKDANTTTKR